MDNWRRWTISTLPKSGSLKFSSCTYHTRSFLRPEEEGSFASLTLLLDARPSVPHDMQTTARLHEVITHVRRLWWLPRCSTTFFPSFPSGCRIHVATQWGTASWKWFPGAGASFDSLIVWYPLLLWDLNILRFDRWLRCFNRSHFIGNSLLQFCAIFYFSEVNFTFLDKKNNTWYACKSSSSSSNIHLR